MDIKIEQDVKCSTCGQVNNYKIIQRKSTVGLKTLKKCLNCGHEKTDSILTVSGTDVEITFPGTNKEILF